MDTRSFAERCRDKLGIKGITQEEWKAQFETRQVLEHSQYAAMSDAGPGEFLPLCRIISQDTSVRPRRVLEILETEEWSR